MMIMEELRRVGLLDDSPEPHLTDKGRDWLRTLERVGSPRQEDDLQEAAADLVLSTNGLFR